MFWQRGWCLAVLMAFALGNVSHLVADDKVPLPEAPKETSTAPRTPKDEQYYELMRIIAETFEQVDRNYVKEVDRRKLAEAALRGMMEELDPYSNYIAPDDLSRFSANIEQEFGGIGIQVTVDQASRRLTVMTPLPGTPAYKAGMKAGDLITEIDGKSTEGMSLDAAVKMLKGKPGEAVTLGVLHAGESKVGQVKLVRAIIHVASVLGDTYKPDDSWEFMIDKANKIAYLRLTTFSRDSTEEIKQALQELKDADFKGLILDLRFNPGGLLTAATEIADLFLESGKIVSTKGRNTPEKSFYARKDGTFSGFPMAILINHYSASASEIVSAALQDHKRAVVIGDRSWGKGSVQNVIQLESGKSALKLTTASYHRPSGKNIHKFPGAKDEDEWGVMPDSGYTVKVPLPEMQKYLEYRRARDVLGKGAPPKSEFVDVQLAKALDYVRSQLKAEKDKTPKSDAPAKAEKTAEKPAEKPAAKPDDKSSSAIDAGKILRSFLKVPMSAAG